jgi:hypothetical protein
MCSKLGTTTCSCTASLSARVSHAREWALTNRKPLWAPQSHRHHRLHRCRHARHRPRRRYLLGPRGLALGLPHLVFIRTRARARTHTHTHTHTQTEREREREREKERASTGGGLEGWRLLFFWGGGSPTAT